MIYKTTTKKNFKFKGFNFNKIKMTVFSDQKMLLFSDVKNNHFKITFEIEKNFDNWKTQDGHLVNAHLKMVVTAKYEVIDLISEDKKLFDVKHQLTSYTINYCHFPAYQYKNWDEQLEKQVLLNQLKQHPQKMNYLYDLVIKLKPINNKK